MLCQSEIVFIRQLLRWVELSHKNFRKKHCTVRDLKEVLLIQDTPFTNLARFLCNTSVCCSLISFSFISSGTSFLSPSSPFISFSTFLSPHAERMRLLRAHWKIYTTVQIPFRCASLDSLSTIQQKQPLACATASAIWALLLYVNETDNLCTQIFPYSQETQSFWSRTSKHGNNAVTLRYEE